MLRRKADQDQRNKENRMDVCRNSLRQSKFKPDGDFMNDQLWGRCARGKNSERKKTKPKTTARL